MKWNKEGDMPAQVEYEDLSASGKTLFDRSRALKRSERKALAEEGHDVLEILSRGLDDSRFLDKVFDMVYGECKELDDLDVFEENVLVTEILFKTRWGVGQRDRKN